MFKKYHREIEFCTFCPKMCKFACPVGNATGDETLTPWGRQTLLHLVGQGHIEFDREVASVMYRCAACLLCRQYCDHLIEVPPVMVAAREKAVAEGVAPVEVGEFRGRWSRHNNPFGDDLRTRVKTLVPETYFAKEAQVLFFAGCRQIYHHPSVVKDTFKVFEAMGIDYVACHEGEAMCCGAPLRELGLRDEYEKNASALAERLGGYKVIISGSPACVYELKVMYRQMDLKITPKVYHTTEFLWPMVKEGNFVVRKPFPRKIMYHDPCTLGRYLGVYDAPRSLLAHVLREEMGEFSRNRAESECCGGYGGLTITDEKLASHIAKDRLGEFLESDAATLVTACPACADQFQTADKKIEVMDLISLLARCL